MSRTKNRISITLLLRTDWEAANLVTTCTASISCVALQTVRLKADGGVCFLNNYATTWTFGRRTRTILRTKKWPNRSNLLCLSTCNRTEHLGERGRGRNDKSVLVFRAHQWCQDIVWQLLSGAQGMCWWYRTSQSCYSQYNMRSNCAVSGSAFTQNAPISDTL